MKEGIHPAYNIVDVVCVCGNRFQTRSTLKGEIRLDVCSACHPFFTGKQKLLDTVGSVSKFKRRYNATGGRTVRRKPKVAKKLQPESRVQKKVKPKKAEEEEEE